MTAGGSTRGSRLPVRHGRRRFLQGTAALGAEQPEIAGISVPGMPAGSPGMTAEFREPMRVWTIPSDSGQDPEVFGIYREVDEWR